MELGTKVSGKPRPGGSRREEILVAALKLFGEHGVHAVTTRQIAAAVGISQPSLYAFFPNKQTLAAEACTRAFEDLAERLTVGIEALKRGDCNVRDLGKIYVDFGLTHPAAYRLAFMVEKRDLAPDASAGGLPILAAGLKAFDLLREAVGLTIGAALPSEEFEPLAQSLWASLHGLVSLLLARPDFPWSDRCRLIELHVARAFAQAACAP
jgi:AcrR family transcriptional regulator